MPPGTHERLSNNEGEHCHLADTKLSPLVQGGPPPMEAEYLPAPVGSAGHSKSLRSLRIIKGDLSSQQIAPQTMTESPPCGKIPRPLQVTQAIYINGLEPWQPASAHSNHNLWPLHKFALHEYITFRFYHVYVRINIYCCLNIEIIMHGLDFKSFPMQTYGLTIKAS